ncbi:hypothetical protein [Bacillus sp. JCM 19041]|uniref:hypothetical protein n=1 Tax=Bacillus sp. JCM 19041 TaxID=1460637 RepID=UPI000AC8BA1A
MTNAQKQSMQAKAASATIASASTEEKNNVLKQMAHLLIIDAPFSLKRTKKILLKQKQMDKVII